MFYVFVFCVFPVRSRLDGQLATICGTALPPGAPSDPRRVRVRDRGSSAAKKKAPFDLGVRTKPWPQGMVKTNVCFKVGIWTPKRLVSFRSTKRREPKEKRRPFYIFGSTQYEIESGTYLNMCACHGPSDLEPFPASQSVTLPFEHQTE